MSTTVKYKGNTLATVSNDTKTLKTAGKYMEGDVELTDVSSTILITKDIVANGTYNASNDNADGYSSVIVNVPTGSTINNQNKSVNPTESQQSITADSGYTGLGTVTVGAIASDYIGSAIPLKSSADITEAAMYYNSMGPRIRHDINFSSGYYSTTGQKAIYTNIADITSMPTLSAQTITPTESVQYISSYQWLTGSQTIAAIPSSYIIPSGTYSVTANGTYDIGSYASVDVNVAGGGGSTVDQIAMRTISGSISGSANCIGSYAFAYCYNLSTASFPVCTTISYNAFLYCSNLGTASFPVCTSIGTNAFASCSILSTISFPLCTTIGNNAFAYCYILSTASFPVCTTISNAAFGYCSNLGTASFPVCISIGSTAFANCFNLSTVSFPVCTTIGNNAFVYCSNLGTASFPVCTSIGIGAFSYCSNLGTISFPVCTSIGAGAFSYCSNLGTISFPLCKTIGTGAFSYCYNLSTASFPVCTSIGSYAFAYCRNLLSLYLLGSSRAWLTNQNVFLSTPISNYTTSTGGIHGSIFVPASLYNSYISAKNWSVYSSRFVGLTDEQIAAL